MITAAPIRLEDWYAELARTHPEMVSRPERRPRGARGRWHPVLARLYGIKPWEMGRVTLGELRLIHDDLAQLVEANR